MQFAINDVVWGKVQGYPYWPCIIQYHKPEQQRCRVVFYGDNLQGEIKYSDLKNFEEHFEQYTQHAKKNHNLRIAIEAVLTSEIYQGLQSQYDRIVKNVTSKQDPTTKEHRPLKYQSESNSSKSRPPKKIEIFIQKFFVDVTAEMADQILEICENNEKKVVKAIKAYSQTLQAGITKKKFNLECFEKYYHSSQGDNFLYLAAEIPIILSTIPEPYELKVFF